MVLEEVDFYLWLEWFESVGGFDIILPFLLIFTITFAILWKIRIFDNKKINVVISFIIAAFLIMQVGLVEIIQGFLPRVSMIVLVVLMVLLVLGIFSPAQSTWPQHLMGLGVIFSIIAILWAIGASSGWEVPLLDLITEQDIAILIIIGVFILVIWLIVKEPTTGGGFWGKVKDLGEFITKPGGG